MTSKEEKRKQRVNYIVLDPADQLEAAKRLQHEGTRALREAKRNMEAGAYPESARASRLAMEKFAKSILAACVGKYPQTHRFHPKDCIAALRNVENVGSPLPASLLHPACAWAFLVSNMWSPAYTPMIHGIEEVPLSPEDLFQRPRAERAFQDAQDCSLAVTWLLSKG